MSIKTIRLANGRKFKTKWQANEMYVEDINSRKSGVIVLTFRMGAQTFKRMYASWYVTSFDKKGQEVSV